MADADNKPTLWRKERRLLICLNLNAPANRQYHNVQILFFVKQDDFGNFHF
jgi:hypothetical protein